MEFVYAVAEIHWQDDRVGGVSHESARFSEEDSDGRTSLEVYLNGAVSPGDTVICPIADVSYWPVDGLLQPGGRFELTGYNGVTQAQGHILSVRGASPSASDTAFQDILQECRKPTTDVLRKALHARSSLTEGQADHINYLAGFTHYEEAAPLLDEFGMTLGEGIPTLFDHHRETRHLKLLLNDLTHHVVGLAPVVIAEQYQNPIFKNKIHDREPSGKYVTNFQLSGMEREAAFRYLNSLEIGLGELVTAFPAAGTEMGGKRTIIHTSRIPARNTAENLKRLFSNVSVIVTAYAYAPRFNLSLERLLDCPEIRPMLIRAFWVLLETEDVAMPIQVLKAIGAEYVVVPFSTTRKDYLDLTLAFLQERFSSARKEG